jgi:hypothetical protein
VVVVVEEAAVEAAVVEVGAARLAAPALGQGVQPVVEAEPTV